MTLPYDPRWSADHLLCMGFDQYQRYRLMAELLVALKQAAAAQTERWQVLDVGGFDRLVDGTPWLPMVAFAADDDVTVVDVVACELEHYRQASGTELPFPADAFDVVISCDTLEHVPQQGRTAFLQELCRVARRAVIFAAPHATAGVSYAERALDEYLRSFGMVHPMLDEHLAYGIPEPEWVERWLADAGLSFVTFPSGYLPRWLPMMMLRHQLVPIPSTRALYQRLEQTYNERFYERDQRGPGYRRVYVAMLEGPPPDALQPFVERAARPEPEDAAADLLGIAVAPLIRALTHLTRVEGAFASLEEQYRRFAEHHHPLVEAHQALSAAHAEALARAQAAEERAREAEAQAHAAVAQAAVLEAEKSGLQQQLELLRWQNQLLQSRKDLAGPLRAAQRRLVSVGRLLRRRRRRS